MRGAGEAVTPAQEATYADLLDQLSKLQAMKTSTPTQEKMYGYVVRDIARFCEIHGAPMYIRPQHR